MKPSEQLRAIRHEIGWTQETMAGCLNIGSTYLSQLESGKRPIHSWIIKKAKAVQEEAKRLDPSLRLDPVKMKVPESAVDLEPGGDASKSTKAAPTVEERTTAEFVQGLMSLRRLTDEQLNRLSHLLMFDVGENRPTYVDEVFMEVVTLAAWELRRRGRTPIIALQSGNKHVFVGVASDTKPKEADSISPLPAGTEVRQAGAKRGSGISRPTRKAAQGK